MRMSTTWLTARRERPPCKLNVRASCVSDKKRKDKVQVKYDYVRFLLTKNTYKTPVGKRWKIFKRYRIMYPILTDRILKS